MKIVFLDSASMGADMDLSRFSKYGDFTAYPGTSPEETIPRIKDATIAILNKTRISKEVLDAAPLLKLICITATGTDNIDVEYAKKCGVAVRNVAGYSTDSVAQIAFTHILAQVDHAVYFNNYVHSGTYSSKKVPAHYDGHYFFELSGKTIGIIGMGAIGRRVASIASAFGMNVVYYSTSGNNNQPGFTRMELNDMLAIADIVTVHAPLNASTRYLMDISRFKIMKPTAYFFNMGRGDIVVEADLVEALNTGLIAGAGVDVYSKEPIPSDHVYFQVKDKDKLFLTPHIAWVSNQARVRLLDATENSIKETFGF